MCQQLKCITSITRRLMIRMKDQLNILILPEGIKSECLRLFRYSLDCADFLPEAQFILRVHPILNIENIIKSFPKIRYKKNIIISKNIISDDYKIANFAIFSGSSSIIQAVSNGLKPIYYSLNNNLNINPLYNIEKYIYTLTDRKSLINFIYN